jgi:hypothetical protein
MEGAALLQLDDLEYIVAVGDCTSIRIWDQSGCQLISCDTYDGEVVTKLLFRSPNPSSLFSRTLTGIFVNSDITTRFVSISVKQILGTIFPEGDCFAGG